MKVISPAFEVLRYRSLIRNLVTKDLKVRYKNSTLGFLWSLLNPLLLMLVFTFVFTQLLAQEIPDFPVFVLAALLPWTWTSTAISIGTNSLIDNAPLINKVYFPRYLLPASVVMSTGVNFVLGLPALFLLMAVFGRPFTQWMLYIPVIVLVQAIFLTGLVLFLAPLHVYLRDTMVVVDVGLTAWFFLTPILYSIEMVVPDFAPWMYRINPMAAIVAEYRTILYDGGVPDPLFMGRTGVTALVLLVLAFLFFRRLNRNIGEHL
jgi:lipopolysaccharide transport system permease protein